MQVVISYHVFVTVTKTTEEAGTALPNVVDQGHAEPIAREQATPLIRTFPTASYSDVDREKVGEKVVSSDE
jgi:hypothetical protein